MAAIKNTNQQDKERSNINSINSEVEALLYTIRFLEYSIHLYTISESQLLEREKRMTYEQRERLYNFICYVIDHMKQMVIDRLLSRIPNLTRLPENKKEIHSLHRCVNVIQQEISVLLRHQQEVGEQQHLHNEQHTISHYVLPIIMEYIQDYANQYYAESQRETL